MPVLSAAWTVLARSGSARNKGFTNFGAGRSQASAAQDTELLPAARRASPFLKGCFRAIVARLTASASTGRYRTSVRKTTAETSAEARASKRKLRRCGFRQRCICINCSIGITL